MKKLLFAVLNSLILMPASWASEPPEWQTPVLFDLYKNRTTEAIRKKSRMYYGIVKNNERDELRADFRSDRQLSSAIFMMYHQAIERRSRLKALIAQLKSSDSCMNYAYRNKKLYILDIHFNLLRMLSIAPSLSLYDLAVFSSNEFSLEVFKARKTLETENNYRADFQFGSQTEERDINRELLRKCEVSAGGYDHPYLRSSAPSVNVSTWQEFIFELTQLFNEAQRITLEKSEVMDGLDQEALYSIRSISFDFLRYFYFFTFDLGFFGNGITYSGLKEFRLSLYSNPLRKALFSQHSEPTSFKGLGAIWDAQVLMHNLVVQARNRLEKDISETIDESRSLENGDFQNDELYHHRLVEDSQLELRRKINREYALLLVEDLQLYNAKRILVTRMAQSFESEHRIKWWDEPLETLFENSKKSALSELKD